MSEFINRQGTNLNNKVLEVESVERDDSGEISKLYVKVSRNDNITKEGTALNAESLKKVINSMIKSALQNYDENGLAELETAEATVLFDGSSAMYDSFGITVNEAVTIVVENDYSEYFSVSLPTTASAGTIEVLVTAINDPDNTGAIEFDFIIKLYSQATTKMIKKVICTVTFQAPSSSAED